MLAFSGTSTIAAAHGTTLNENASSYVLDTNAILNIGSPGEDGTVLWHTNPGSFGSGVIDGVRVQAGTLRAADDSFSLLVEEGSTQPLWTQARPLMSRASTATSPIWRAQAR
jgi:hypothetical protein